MEEMLLLLGLHLLLLGTILWIITMGVRKVLEKALPSLKGNSWWRDILLPFFPAALGGLITGLTPYPVPTALSLAPELPVPLIVRIGYGLVVGYFSAGIYRAVVARGKAHLAGTTPALPPPSNDNAPPPSLTS